MSYTDASPVTDKRNGQLATSYVARQAAENQELIDWAYDTGDEEIIRDYGQEDNSWMESLEDDIICGKYDDVDGPIPDAGECAANPAIS